MVMDHLPSVRLTAIDVRDSKFDGDLVSGELKLPVLDTQFESRIPGNVNNLVTQFNLPV